MVMIEKKKISRGNDGKSLSMAGTKNELLLETSFPVATDLCGYY